MSGPAEIVRAALVAQNLVLMPGDTVNQLIPFQQIPFDGSMPCYVSSMPDEIDQGLLLRDVAGHLFARRMEDGKYLVHCGLKLLMRTIEYDYDSVNALFNAITAISKVSIPITDPAGNIVQHFVQTIYRTSTIIPLGEEVGKRRQLWSLNVRVAMQDQEPQTG